MITENITFKNNKDETISGIIYKGTNISRIGVIFCHGLFSSKDAYKITKLAPDIVAAGFTLMTFNFSFIEKNRPGEISISQEVQDLKAAIKFFNGLGIQKLHLIGSSMGGVVAILLAALSPDQLLSVVAIATPIDLTGLVKTMTNTHDPVSISPEGTTLIDDIPMNNNFFIEALGIEPLAILKKISLPLLVIHGENDEVVNVANVALFKKESISKIKSIIINNGNHNMVRDNDIVILRDSIIHWLLQGHKE